MVSKEKLKSIEQYSNGMKQGKFDLYMEIMYDYKNGGKGLEYYLERLENTLSEIKEVGDYIHTEVSACIEGIRQLINNQNLN